MVIWLRNEVKQKCFIAPSTYNGCGSDIMSKVKQNIEAVVLANVHMVLGEKDEKEEETPVHLNARNYDVGKCGMKFIISKSEVMVRSKKSDTIKKGIK
ncbi:hypothetical protein PR048_008971 [Dryococelus australis]|uniref:Uncharacterized protein n=1 Tax=Dryococelus australis TaxID=614101 RepID=A0ABQ9HYK8_9NEOP|nr:hypothetical protein PR048_008971 [Dryococelus australis]